jgi:putative copper resistance protein D
VTAWPGSPATLTVAAAVALGAMLAALVLGGGRPQAAVGGLSEAAALTGWGLAISKLAFDLAAISTVGTLLTAVVLLPPQGNGPHPLQTRVLGAAFWSASVWAVSAVAGSVFTVSDVSGHPVSDLLAGGGRVLWQGLSVVPLAAALLVSAVAAVAVAASAAWTSTVAARVRLLAVAVLGLTPTLFTGHAATAADHDLATTSLVVHVVAATCWLGGLGGLVVFLRGAGPALAAATARYSSLALACFLLVAASGALNAWTRLGTSVAAWTSGYGALVAAKTGALIALGGLGWAHRRRTLPRLDAGLPRAFLRLAVVELTLMAATVGVAVALGRTPATTGSAAAARAPSHGAGHATLPVELVPFSPVRLLTEWRPDAITLALVAIAGIWYLRRLRSLHRQGRRWPLTRTASFVAGLAVVVLATCGGLAIYAPALLSVHVARFFTLGLLGPALVCLGAPVTLDRLAVGADGAAEAAGNPVTALVPRRLAASLGDPINGLVLFVVVLYLIYITPVLTWSLRSVPANLATSAVPFGIGAVLLWPVLARDPVPEPEPRGSRLAITALLLLALAAFAGYLATWEGVLGAGWFDTLEWNWSDPMTDQQRAAVVVAGFTVVLGAPLLLAVWRLPAPEPDGSEEPDYGA